MRILKYIVVLLMSLTFLAACDFEEDLNIDPNKPSKPDTRFLFLQAETYATSYAWNSGYNPWVQLYPQYISELKNIQFTAFNITEYSTKNMYTVVMKNLKKIIDLNKDEKIKNEGWISLLGDSNNQIGMCMTLKAFYMMHMTDIVGALPYSEALEGTENFTPKFDSQEEIYTELFKELNEAYVMFDEKGSINSQYDILYNGNVSSWKKLNASIRMMMAIKLQKAAPTIGKAEFAKAYNDGAIVDNTDNLVYKYLLENDNANPIWDNMIKSGRQDFSPSSTIVDVMNKYNDPRVPEYFAPNEDGNYVGAIFGWNKDEAGKHSLSEYSAFNDKYYKKQNAPMTLVSAAQVLLMATEAAHIGWINDDVATLYKKGITASFTQHNIPENKVDTYIAGSDVVLDGNDDIKKIAMQKWIANYMQDGVEAWSDWRRLQIPDLKPGVLGSVSTKHIPYRLRYAESAIVSNKENYEAAIAAQGADDINTKLWWNK